MQDTVQGDCHYLIYQDQAPTSGMTKPQATGQGSYSANATMSGSAGDPLVPSGNVTWNAYVSITQNSLTSVLVTGSLHHKCFPAYELSVGGTDVDYQPPQASDIGSIFVCLAGFGQLTEQINQVINVTP